MNYGSVAMYVQQTVNDPPLQFPKTSTDSEGRFSFPTDLRPFVGQLLRTQWFGPNGEASPVSDPILIEDFCDETGGSGDCPYADAVDDEAEALRKGPAVTIDVLANDTYTQPARLINHSGLSPDAGTLVYNGDGTFTFTPNDTFHGDATFSYSLGYEQLVEEPILYDPSGALGTAFGTSVSIDGDTAIVGAPADSVVGPQVGCAYVYRRAGNAWTLAQRIENPAPQGTTYFGECVGITGDRILIANNHGTEYEEYDLVNGTWQYAGALLISEGGMGILGQHFAVGGGYAIFSVREGTKLAKFPTGGAPAVITRFFDAAFPTRLACDTDGTTCVRSYRPSRAHFTISGQDQDGEWTNVRNFTYTNGGTPQGAAVSGGHALAGWQSGALRAYRKDSSGTWEEAGSVDAMPLAAANNNLLGPIDMDGDYALIGTYADTARPLYAGLYALEQDGDWALRGEYGQPAGGFLHTSVAVSKGRGMIGMPYDSQPAAGTGSVRPLQILARDTATVTIHVDINGTPPPAPVLTQTYPVRGTATPDATVHLFTQATPGAPSIPLGSALADANGDFLSDADTVPFVGQYLVATAEVDGLMSPESALLLIESPCPLPEVPDKPYPALGTTLVEPTVSLVWDNLPAKSDESPAPLAWEPTLDDCAAPLNLALQAPTQGTKVWDGLSFMRDGVVFATDSPARLYLGQGVFNVAPNIPFIFATEHVSNLITDKPIQATFLAPTDCVSLEVVDVSPQGRPWTVTAFDALDRVISEYTDTVLNGKFHLEFPGIQRVRFTPSSDLEAITAFSYVQLDCPVTYDVFLGTTPVSMNQICDGNASPACPTPPLATNTTYYWQVIAKGARGEVTGPLWNFTTRPVTVARDDVYVMFENAAPTTLNVLSNDTNDTGPLSIVSFTLPATGTMVKNGNETFTYQPPPGFNGQVRFTYTVAAGGPGSITTAEVGVVVLPRNSAPVVAHPLPDFSVPTSSAPVGVNATLAFSDPDGDTLEYTVAANSAPTLVNPVRSGAGFSLQFSPGPTGTADITLRATDPDGLFAEDTFRVTVGSPPTPPVISQQPQPQVVNYLDTATFSCAATSNALLSYRWQRDGIDLNDDANYSGTATPQLTIADALNALEGGYRCVVSNVAHATNTASATLTVRDPYITVQPADTTGGVGGTAAFEVSVLGSGTLTFQWYIGTTALPESVKYTGATAPRLTVNDLIDQPGNTDEQLYHVRIQGADAQPVDSRVALLSIADPFIARQPESLQVRAGTTTRFSVLAIGTAPILYRWSRDGTPLNDGGRYAGTRTDSLVIQDAEDADEGDYACTVVGQEIVTSDVARLTVTHLPEIIGLRVTPSSGIVKRGSAFNLELLLAEPVSGLSYSWSCEGQPLSEGPRVLGSATPVLSVSDAEESDEGRYVCTITDGADTDASPPGMVRVGLAFSVDLPDAQAEVGQRFTWATSIAGQTGAVTYAWYRQVPGQPVEPVMNGPRVSGADAGTLSIDPVELADEALYTLYAMDDADIAVSRVATLQVFAEVPLGSGLAISTLALAISTAAAAGWRRGVRRKRGDK